MKIELNDKGIVCGTGFKVVLNDSSISYKKPESVEEYKNTIDKLGFFDTPSEPQTFYPEIKSVEDIIPKDEDYYKQPFRLLSATIVAGGTWRATDFSNTTVLRRSASILEGLPVYTDHNMDNVNNQVGIIKNVRFSNGYTDANGNEIPAGIDADIWVDVKTHPQVARNVARKTLNSGSVTVVFNWEASHVFRGEDALYDFENAIGTYRDGEMVRRIVTNIELYYEYSLVLQGADPYAKQINDNGELNKPSLERAFKEEIDEVKQAYKGGSYSLNCSLDKNIKISKSLINNKHEAMVKKELLQSFLDKLGLKDEFNEEFVANFTIDSIGNPELVKLSETILGNFAEGTKLTDAIKDSAFILKSDLDKLQVDVDSLTVSVTEKETEIEELSNKIKETGIETGKLKAENAELSENVETLKATIEKNKHLVEVGLNAENDKREEVKRLYSLTVKNDTKESVLGMINKATSDELEGLLESYGGSLAKEYSATCKDCNSTNIKMGSTVKTEEYKENDSYVEDIRESKLSENNKNIWK